MYSPSSSSEDIESEDDNANAAEEKKYIVFENELDKLFKFLPTVWKHNCDQNKTSSRQHDNN